MLEAAGCAGSGKAAVKFCNFEETLLPIAITKLVLTEFGWNFLGSIPLVARGHFQI